MVLSWRSRKFPRGLTGSCRHAILLGRGSPLRGADPRTALRMAAEAPSQSEKRTISGKGIEWACSRIVQSDDQDPDLKCFPVELPLMLILLWEMLHMGLFRLSIFAQIY